VAVGLLETAHLEVDHRDGGLQRAEAQALPVYTTCVRTRHAPLERIYGSCATHHHGLHDELHFLVVGDIIRHRRDLAATTAGRSGRFIEELCSKMGMSRYELPERILAVLGYLDRG